MATIDLTAKVIVAKGKSLSRLFARWVIWLVTISLGFAICACSGRNEPRVAVPPVSKSKQRSGTVTTDIYPVVGNGGRVGYVDARGAFVIQPVFSEALPFIDGVAVVDLGRTDPSVDTEESVAGFSPASRVGYIDTEGRFLINPNYGCGTSMRSDYAAVAKTVTRKGNTSSCSNWEIIDRKGARTSQGDRQFSVLLHSGLPEVFLAAAVKEVVIAGDVSQDCSSARARRNETCYDVRAPSRVVRQNLVGYINTRGDWVLGSPYQNAWPFGENLAIVSDNCTGYVIDKNGKKLAETDTRVCGSAVVGVFHDGLAVAMPKDERTEQYGYINSQGRFEIDPQFDDARDFSGGLGAVRIGDQWGYIDKNGKLVSAPIYVQAWPFVGEVAPVCGPNRQIMFIDRSFKVRSSRDFSCGGARTSSVSASSAGFLVRTFDWVELTDSYAWFNKLGQEVYRFPPASENEADSVRPKDAVARSSTGTAFVVGTKGQLLTNAHVVRGCGSVRIPSLDKSAVVLRVDSANDLALLILEHDLPNPLPLVSEGNVAVGDAVAVFGFPLGGIVASEGNLTSGIVSAMSGPNDDSRYFQMTAPMQPGNSGGPVVNRYGELVGVASASLRADLTYKASGALPQNINFAIGPNAVKGFLRSHAVAHKEGAGWLRRTIPMDKMAGRLRSISFHISCAP